MEEVPEEGKKAPCPEVFVFFGGGTPIDGEVALFVLAPGGVLLSLIAVGDLGPLLLFDLARSVDRPFLFSMLIAFRYVKMF